MVFIDFFCKNPIAMIESHAFIESRDSCFHLPIEYLPSKFIHTVSPHVMEDLELVTMAVSNNEKNATNCIPPPQTTEHDGSSRSEESLKMHTILFQPSHEFAQQLLPRWANKMTSHVKFLKETQQILRSFQWFDYIPETGSEVQVLRQMWTDVKEDTSFLSKYSYMEFDALKKLNESSIFLQSISTIHVVSPLISILTPFLFCLIPLIVLQLKNIPISFKMYLDLLKQITKNHIIGQSIQSFEHMQWDKCGYLLVSTGLYFFQIYGNFMNAIHFYTYIQKINLHLLRLKSFSGKITRLMDIFFEKHANKKTYSAFCMEMNRQCDVLKQISVELNSISPFAYNLSTFKSFGDMLKCYYHLHDNQEYGVAMDYAFKFEGYMNNLNGVYDNLQKGAISFAKLKPLAKSGSDKTAGGNQVGLKIVRQYYPAIAKEKAVKNSCMLRNGSGIIVSGPNASGKTTYLKNTAINIIMSQQIGAGYYEKCVLQPYTYIHSYLNIPDTSGRDSLFQAESRRCKEILTQLEHNEHRHFCIFDELFSGTNPREASMAGWSFITYLSKFHHVNFILTTHYVDICNRVEEEKEHSNICNYQMSVDNTHEDGKLRYLYSLKKGISKVEGAKSILLDLDFPEDIINQM